MVLGPNSIAGFRAIKSSYFLCGMGDSKSRCESRPLSEVPMPVAAEIPGVRKKKIATTDV